MRSVAWWKEAFANERERWKAALLEAPAGEPDWNRAVRRWLGPEELEDEITRIGRGPLSGVPFGVKDLFDQKGGITRAGSILLEEVGAPATEDAAIVRRLREEGAVPVGRTNMNEFAYGLDGFNPHTGDCPHPRDPERISGGSSSGSAWIVAKGILPVALGTDTGGSVRVPAALCGIYGFRGVPEEEELEGVFPLARSFDTTGWFTSTPEDMLELLRLLWEGRNPLPETDSESRTGRSVWYAPRTVRLSAECGEAYREYLENHPAVERTTALSGEIARKLDAVCEDSFWAYNVIGSCEAFQVHRGWFTKYKERYNPDVWRLIDRSRHWESGSLNYARRLKDQVTSLLNDVLARCEAILMPAVHTVAPRKSEVDQEFRVDIIRLTSLASLAGVPVLTIPLEAPGGLSCGVQVIAGPERIVRVAQRLLPGGSA
jgi:Asp-tRNA(Asn)/Glu-tRNA(Gln) amidotransferase A subunit family amidase